MESHEVDEVDALIRTAFLTALVTDGSEQDLVKRLRSSAGYLPEQELVALDDDRLVGHILTTRIVIDGEAGPVDALEVVPLCVALDHRCRGIGALLVEEALKRGRAAGFPAVFLVGDSRY
jgi:acetyltransferase, GNAT family